MFAPTARSQHEETRRFDKQTDTTHLSEPAEHLRDGLCHQGRLLPLHEGDTVVRAREELVLLRQLHPSVCVRLDLVDDFPSLRT